MRDFNLGKKIKLLKIVIVLWGQMIFLVVSMPGQAQEVTFFHISDQHYTQEDTRVDTILINTIQTMNVLPGASFPEEIGGKVNEPRGVIMTGDLTDNGKPEEWVKYIEHWGLTGKEGLINFPVFEGAGNHDGAPSSDDDDADKGFVRQQIIKRNSERPGITNVSENGLHYSWDWDSVHFVMLNEYAGLEKEEPYGGNPGFNRKEQRYGNPAENSLQFLRKDLETQIGDSKRPVVLLQHYGFDGFALHPWGGNAAWWTEEHAMRLWETIEGYNVIAILSGHDGSEAILNWNGIPNYHMDDASKFRVHQLEGPVMKTVQYNSKTNEWGNTYSQSSKIDASLPPELVQGPYLVYEGIPGEMTVLWRTNTNITCKLSWGDDRFEYEDGKIDVDPCDEKNHLYKYTIKGLTPNTSIKYALEINDRFAPGMFFTDPTGEDEVKFLIAGEQPNTKSLHKLYKTFYNLIYNDPAYHSIILHPGEMVSKPESMNSWDQEYFSRNRDKSHMRWMQSRSVLGVTTNDSELKQRLFPAARDDGQYFFDYGPVRIAVLNSEKGLGADSEQRNWMKSAFSPAKAVCRIVMWNPPKNRDISEKFKDNLHALCDELGVNLIVSGGEGFKSSHANATNSITLGTKSMAVQVEDGKITCRIFNTEGKTIRTFKR